MNTTQKKMIIKRLDSGYFYIERGAHWCQPPTLIPSDVEAACRDRQDNPDESTEGEQSFRFDVVEVVEVLSRLRFVPHNAQTSSDLFGSGCFEILEVRP